MVFGMPVLVEKVLSAFKLALIARRLPPAAA